ncbi:hypothetical protein APHNP_0436 [Anaplasma phagocytophilum str. ApNP]|uniref:Uncharacterized protein n=1 Tax=Anaplasma phagocytophilum str. ApNP TaxID=1359153 RepID=A0A0F3NK77_ANAPH|nr:hypothetical protein APHNP_0436 [Anaplasma phagocytophilum str. ApNP]
MRALKTTWPVTHHTLSGKGKIVFVDAQYLWMQVVNKDKSQFI